MSKPNNGAVSASVTKVNKNSFGPSHHAIIAFSIIFIILPCIYIPVTAFVSGFDYKNRTKNQCGPLLEQGNRDTGEDIKKYIRESQDGKSIWPFTVYCRTIYPPGTNVNIFDS